MGLGSASLRTRLLLLVLLAVIPAFVLLAFTALEQRRDAQAQVAQEALRFARTAAIEQRHLIAGAHQLLVSLAQLPAVQAASAEPCNSLFARLLKQQQPYYANLGAIGADGAVFCSGLPMSGRVYAGDRMYFRQALETRDFAIGDYQIGRITGKSSINAGYPVFDASGQLQAVVFAALDLAWLSELLAETLPSEGAALTVVDSKRTVLERYPAAADWVGKVVAESPLIEAILAHKGEGTLREEGLDGVKRIYAFTPLYRTPASEVYVSFGIPEAVAFADANQAFARNMSVLALVALIVLAAAWFGSGTLVLRRVNALTSAAKRLGQGDLAARTGLTPVSGELGQLAMTFDHMAASLQTQQIRLEEMAAKLRRVNRALMALSAGNRTLVRAEEEQALLQDMCKVIVEVGGYRLAWVGYAEQDQQKTVRPVEQAGFSSDRDFATFTRTLNITWADTERGRGPVGMAIRTGEPYVVRDIATDPNFTPFREQAHQQGRTSIAAFPLRVDGAVIGALSISHGEANAFDEEEMRLLTEMADDLAYGIETLRTRIAREQADKAIHHMAYHDALTGLPNHAQLQEHLQRALRDAEKRNRSLALLLLGLNRFRQINETLGFEHGNTVLKEIGPRIHKVMQDLGFVARMRGDEFAIVQPVSDTEKATQTAEQILGTLKEPLLVGGFLLDVQAAIGIALFPEHATDASDLIRRTDVALHQAKRSGSDYAVYAAEYERETPRRLALAAELRQAIDKGDLVLHYQPKIDMRSGRVCGAEALVRWQHPKDGMIPPGEFIGIAEHTGLIRPLTYWVLEASVRQAHTWHQQGMGMPIAVNLSVRNLRDPKLSENIEQLLAKCGVQPEWLELEITESALMEDPKGALETLSRLSAMGIKLFIDDFGTGYSSLSYLNKLPLDAIKIDKSFVINMSIEPDSAAIVRSTIDLAHVLGLKVVAEGVENQQVWDALLALRCDVSQGYHISKPLPAEAYKAWLSRSPWTVEQRKVG